MSGGHIFLGQCVEIIGGKILLFHWLYIVHGNERVRDVNYKHVVHMNFHMVLPLN